VTFALATLRTGVGPAAAIVVGDRAWLLRDLGDAKLNRSVKDLFENWAANFPRLDKLASLCAAGAYAAELEVDLASASLLVPIAYPNKLIAVGANYRDHLAEMGLPTERWTPLPIFLRPPTTSMVGPGKTVILPKSTREFDWEIELAVVIGARLREVDRATAMASVAGYAVSIDLSARDLIRLDNPMQIDLVRGKAQDTMAPFGPVVVPAPFVPDPHNLRLHLSVNGKTMQDGSTANMLYRIDEQISIISNFITLEPGDVLMTGSPAGSGASHGRFLQAGDRIRAEIESIGCLDVEVTA
jgi:2-keto-4-pentenoate hydratase/2-oxohepta-3-ene-1,7-dioic acid hydratase in catechol pathway